MISDLRVSAESISDGLDPNIEVRQTRVIARAGTFEQVPRKELAGTKGRFPRPTPNQCDINTGTVMQSNMLRVTPPRIRSCNREWPYPPITSRPILLSAATDRIAP